MLKLAKSYAASRLIGLGKALFELVRRGFSFETPTCPVNGLHVAELPSDSPAVTMAKVRELEL